MDKEEQMKEKWKRRKETMEKTDNEKSGRSKERGEKGLGDLQCPREQRL